MNPANFTLSPKRLRLHNPHSAIISAADGADVGSLFHNDNNGLTYCVLNLYRTPPFIHHLHKAPYPDHDTARDAVRTAIATATTAHRAKQPDAFAFFRGDRAHRHAPDKITALYYGVHEPETNIARALTIPDIETAVAFNKQRAAGYSLISVRTAEAWGEVA